MHNAKLQANESTWTFLFIASPLLFTVPPAVPAPWSRRGIVAAPWPCWSSAANPLYFAAMASDSKYDSPIRFPGWKLASQTAQEFEVLKSKRGMTGSSAAKTS